MHIISIIIIIKQKFKMKQNEEEVSISKKMSIFFEVNLHFFLISLLALFTWHDTSFFVNKDGTSI